MTRRNLFALLPGVVPAAATPSRRDGLKFETLRTPLEIDCTAGGCDNAWGTARYQVSVVDQPGKAWYKSVCPRCLDWLLDQGVVLRDRTVYVIDKA